VSFKSTLGGNTGTTDVGMNALNQSNTGLFGNAGTLAPQGQNLLSLGLGNQNAGANYFHNLLGGNQAETTQLLAPDIQRIQGGNQQALQAASTLMPHGAGRSGTLFQLPFQANQQVQSLYNNARGGAAGALANLGTQQSGLGGNLFGIANQALGTAGSQGAALAHIGQTQQAQQNAIVGSIMKGLLGAIGGGLFGAGGGAASAPFGTYTGPD